MEESSRRATEEDPSSGRTDRKLMLCVQNRSRTENQSMNKIWWKKCKLQNTSEEDGSRRILSSFRCRPLSRTWSTRPPLHHGDLERGQTTQTPKRTAAFTISRKCSKFWLTRSKFVWLTVSQNWLLHSEFRHLTHGLDTLFDNLDFLSHNLFWLIMSNFSSVLLLFWQKWASVICSAKYDCFKSLSEMKCCGLMKQWVSSAVE